MSMSLGVVQPPPYEQERTERRKSAIYVRDRRTLENAAVFDLST